MATMKLPNDAFLLNNALLNILIILYVSVKINKFTIKRSFNKLFRIPNYKCLQEQDLICELDNVNI